MPKTTNTQTPGTVLQSYIDEYQINAFSLSKSIKVAYQSVTNIIKGKGRISTNIALRLGQYFGNAPQYWLDVQSSSEMSELSEDKKFLKILKSIPKANKPKGKVKKEPAGSKKTVKSAGKKQKTVKTKSGKKTKVKKAGRSSKK